ncbi:MAG: hypothetical protein R2857_03135 [Vampirovibrionales bacterium]
MVFDARGAAGCGKDGQPAGSLDLGHFGPGERARQISDDVLRGFVESQILPVIRRAVDELTLFNGLNQGRPTAVAAILRIPFCRPMVPCLLR